MQKIDWPTLLANARDDALEQAASHLDGMADAASKLAQGINLHGSPGYAELKAAEATGFRRASAEVRALKGKPTTDPQ